MNLGDIKTRVQRIFGDSAEVVILESDIVNWANDAQVDIVRQTECLQVRAETSVTGDDGSYTLPTDYLYLKRVSFDGIKLEPLSVDELDSINSTHERGDSTGTPKYYYIWGDTLFLYPEPLSSSTNTLDIFYVKRPDTLSGDTDIPEIPLHLHEDIVRYCLARAKELDEEFEQSQQFQAQYAASMAQAHYEMHKPSDVYPAVRCLPGDEGYY